MTEKTESKNKRMNFLFTERDQENLKTIMEFLEKKFGLTEEMGKTSAVRVALSHYARHIRDGELK